MSIFVGTSLLSQIYDAIFAGGTFVSVPTGRLHVTLLDAALNELSVGARFETNVLTDWTVFAPSPSCDGNLTGLEQGISALNNIPISIQNLSGNTWDVAYVSLYDNAAGPNELFRLKLDTPLEIADNGFFAVGIEDLRVTSTYLV